MSNYRYNGYSHRSSSSSWGDVGVSIVARTLSALILFFVMSLIYSIFAPYVPERYSPKVESDVYDCFFHASSHPDVTRGLDCLRDESYAFQYPEPNGDGNLMLITPYPQEATDLIYGCFDSNMDKYHLYTNQALKCLHDLNYVLTQHREVLPFKSYEPTPTPAPKLFGHSPR